MITVGNRDGGRKGLTEHGFKRWMKDETELEEGEACSYHDGDDDGDDDDEGSTDPDLALSYIDEKLQNVLGHFQKDFEGVVSEENLGAKYGIYGSFLPSYRRSPVWSHPSPQSVQNHTTSQCSNPLQVEGGNHTSLAQTSVPQSLKHGSAFTGSTSKYANKPPSQSGLCRQTAKTQSIKSLEACSPKSEALDQGTLKVRIKVGSNNLSVKKNDAIYNGLGLDGSPSSSFDDSPAESEGLSQGLPCESPTQIVHIMSSFPLIGGHLLSPLPDDIIQLSKRTKLLNYIRTQPSSFKTNHKSLVMGHPCYSVKDNKTFLGENGIKLLNRKGSPLKTKREGDDRCTSFDFSFKETDIDAASREKLVSSALKLPLLSDAYDNLEDLVKKSVKEEVYNAEKIEPLEPFPIPVSLSYKSNGIGEATNSSTNTERVGLKVKKASKGGFKDPAKQKVDKPSSSGNGMGLAHGNAQFSSREKRKSKRSQSHSSSSKKASTESANDRAKALENKQGSDEAYACKSELGDSPLRKELSKASDKNSKLSDTYKDFFGDINDQELDIGDSPDVPCGDRLKTSELIEDILKDKKSNPVAHKRTISDTNLKGLSRSAGMSEKGQPISDAVSDTQDKWVCCDKCQAWRLLPPGSNEESLPDKWDCTMLTWLPGMNRCGISDDETTTAVRARYQVLAETSNSLLVPPDRRATGMISAYNLYPSMLNDEKIVDKVRKTPKSYCQANQPKKVDQHKSDSDSGRGRAKISKINRKRERDEEFPRDSKKNKKRVTQSKDNDAATEHYQDDDMMVSSSFSLATNTPSKMPNLEFFSLQKSDMGGDSSDTSDKKFQAVGLPAVTSLHVNKSGSGIVAPRKRKVDNFQHPASSTPSSGKLIPNHDEISPKKHRTSKSEGRESSFSKQSGKVEKRNKISSRQSLKNTESLQKDPLCALPAVAATSSSSKVSGSLRIKPKFQELIGSPVESVSSSPYRISNSVKLTPGSKIKVEKDSVDRLEPREHISDRCLNEVNGDDGHHNIVSRSEKNVKDFSSQRKDMSMKSNADKGNIKMSESYGNPYDYGPVSEKNEMDGKFKIPETTALTVDKPDKIATFNNQGSSTLKSKAQEDYDPKRSSKKPDVDKYEQLVSISDKEKSKHLLASDGEKNEKSNSLRSNEGNGMKTCSTDACASDRQKEATSNRKANTQNGTHHVPYNRPISNGHMIKNQDAPSPSRRDVTSQAAGNAIKEAKSLKHLADRLKRDSGSTESTGYYFEAALKFLHGASLLESGKTENTKHADMLQSTKIYSDTAKLCGFCAHEYEKCKDMATAALAYKCMEVAYLRVIYSSHHSATRDRHELQTVLHMVPPGESPSSSASDIDNLNNSATVDKDPQVRNGGSPQLTTDLVIAANTRPRFERLLNFAQDVNFAMEASRKSRTAFEAANVKMDKGDSKEVMTSIKRALDFNFHDVHGLLRLVRVAKEATSR